MDALCRYCHAIYDWSNWPNLSLFNEMRLRTAKDLNDKLQKVANGQMDGATALEMSDTEYTESLCKRISELNLEISMYTAKTARTGHSSHPDLNAEQPPKWNEWVTDEYKVNFGTWKGKRIHDMSHNCVQCRLVKTLMEKNEQVLGDLLSAEVDVSLMLDAYELKPNRVLLIPRKPDHNSYVLLEEIKVLPHRGEFRSSRTLFRICMSFRRHFVHIPSSLPLVSCCPLKITFHRCRVTSNRCSTID
jgi:hypothetical protein